MDKQYRTRDIKDKYVTISLTLNKDLMIKLEKAVTKTTENNMSKYIEETVSGSEIKEMPKRREFNTNPIKKTFTFTESFVKEIRPSGNMSLFIEYVLNNKL